jgi:hypothetical protein
VSSRPFPNQAISHSFGVGHGYTIKAKYGSLTRSWSELSQNTFHSGLRNSHFGMALFYEFNCLPDGCAVLFIALSCRIISAHHDPRAHEISGFYNSTLLPRPSSLFLPCFHQFPIDPLLWQISDLAFNPKQKSEPMQNLFRP